MMGSIDTLKLISLLAGLLLLVVALLTMRFQFRLRRRFDEFDSRLAQQRVEIDGLRHLVRAMHDSGEAARKRERELAEHVALLSRQQEQLLLRDTDSGSYLQAIRSAQTGASADSLISTYGLSHGEAELVVALHGPPSGSDSPDD